jgi:hypothetical protein
MSTRRPSLDVVRDRLVARLLTAVPGLDGSAAAAVLSSIGGAHGASLRRLDSYLDTHVDALASPAADCPAALVRLAHALIDAGHTGIAAPRCARCGRPRPDLGRRDADGRRICDTCAAARRVGPCARCGVARRLQARRDEGVICHACYNKDPQAMRECGQCGQRRTPVARAADGSPRCQRCHTRPLHTCASCGARRPASAFTSTGPVCAACYRAPTRSCGRCGQRRPIARRANGDAPDLCYGCYQGRDATCSVCARVRPCQRLGSGRPICKTCRPRPPRPCFHCRRSRPVQAEWPAGPVCVACYERIRRHPAPCRARRPLIGRDDTGARICGPCSGVELTYTCRACGHDGEIHCDQRCFRCVLTERATDLLTGTGGVADQLRPLLDAIRQVDNPATVVAWLARSPSAKLLRQLALAGEPITHDLLDQQPQTQPVHYLRELLVAAGVLPLRDEHLERLGPWLDGILADRPAHQVRLVRPFAHWFVLRRARRAAARSQGFRRGSADFARARIIVALDLLAWLDQTQLALADLTQPILDQWLAEGSTARRAIRYFLQWAHDRRVTGDLEVTLPPKTGPAELLSDDERVAQLRRCLTDEELPLDLRAAGTLMLLFGLLLSRVLQLRTTDMVLDAGDTFLTIDGHRLLLPPRVADLLHRLRCQPRPRWTLARLAPDPGWLFPGQSPTRPAHDAAFASRLQRAGIAPLAGRNGARLALATDLPASVLADLTGIHVTTALQWTTWAKRDWTAFVASRDSASAPRDSTRR